MSLMEFISYTDLLSICPIYGTLFPP